MRHTINLATRIYIDNRKLTFSIVVAFVILIALAAMIIGDIISDLREMGTLNRGISAFEGKTKAVKSSEIPEKDFQALVERIKFANGIIEQKNYDWLLFLDRLEGVVPQGIALSNLEPNPNKGELKLGGVAKSFGNIRKFVRNLEESGFFHDVYLVNHSESQGADGQKVTSFNITCKAKFK